MAAYRGSGGNAEYVSFLRGMKPGDGGKADLNKEKGTRQTVKNRLNRAAEMNGIKLKFPRSRDPDVVIFEVVSRQ
jgi:hypothetical protein